MSTDEPGPSKSPTFSAQVPPPHPLDGEWFIYADGQSYGPYTGFSIRDYVRDGRVDASTNVCKVGSSNWVEAAQDSALASLFAKPPNSLTPIKTPPETGDTTVTGGGTVVQITQTFAGHGAAYDYGHTGPKNPALALFLSFLFPGIGQFYNGQVAKGFLMLILCIALWIVWLGWTIWIWGMIDAYSSAKRINVEANAKAAAALRRSQR